MQRLFALILVFTLWFGFAPSVSAKEEVANLTPCAENTAYLQRAQDFRNTTSNPDSGARRAELYAEALCGPEGYPHLIVDGRWSHMGDFFIPSVLFLYIAGWIGWAGRAYIIDVKDDKNTETKEIIVDVPLALKKMFIDGPLWPVQAFGEFTSGELTVPDNEVPISPR